jgi:aspartate carbamoyltransferase catalytic subunit
MVGDLKNGRTVHSLTRLLSRYNVEFYFVSPDILRMPAETVSEVQARGHKAVEVDDVHEVIADMDVLYVTRVQKERFNDLAAYEEMKNYYVVDAELMEMAKQDMVVMHPLPRVGEISYAVDQDPRAAYFRQMENGMFIRMALLAAVLGKA